MTKTQIMCPRCKRLVILNRGTIPRHQRLDDGVWCK